MVLSASSQAIAAGVKSGRHLVKSLSTEGKARSGVANRKEKPFLGKYPGKGHLRGGLWTKNSLEYFQDASLVAMAPPIGGGDSLSASPAAGPNLPWEGGYQTAMGLVNTANGNLLTTLNLFSFRVRGGMNFSMSIFHNTESKYTGDLGTGWSWSYDMHIYNSGPSYPAELECANGLVIPFTPGYDIAGTTKFTASGIFDTLTNNPDGTWFLLTPSGEQFSFDSGGYLQKVSDRSGNFVAVQRQQGGVLVTGLRTSDGRQINFTRASNGDFGTVTDQAGNVYSFGYDSYGNLISVTRPPISGDGNVDKFGYGSSVSSSAASTAGALSAFSHTDRNGNLSVAYLNATDKSTYSVVDPLGNATYFTYAAPSTSIKNPLGYSMTDNYSSGQLASRVDFSGYSISITQRNVNYQATNIKDKDGYTWSFTFDSNGNPVTLVDPKGNSWSATYNNFAEATSEMLPDRSVFAMSYDSTGNLLSVNDALNNTFITNTYDAYGDLATTADGAGDTTTYSYDQYGNPISETSPNGNTTSLSFDSFGMPLQVTDPLNNRTAIAYDSWERPIQVL